MKLKKQFILGIAISFVVATVVFFIASTGYMDRLEFFTSDIFFRIRRPLTSKQPIIIIEITDYDVEKIGRWPWKRSWHAAMAKVLSDLGAKVVYYDVIFSEPSDEKDDALFEEAIKTTNKVYLPYVFPGRPYDINNTLLPIKRFSSNVKGMGAMNVFPDRDGTIRVIPLIFTGNDGTYSHIALKIVMDCKGLEIKKIAPDRLILSNKETEENIEIPLMSDNGLCINWTGKWIKSFQHYSFIDVLAAYHDYLEDKPTDIDLKNFNGAICLVGITGFGLFDIKPVPLEPEYPGIGIIANALDTLMDENYIHIPPVWMDILLLYFLALLPAFLIRGKNPFKETVFVFLVGVCYFGVAFFLFLKGLRIQIFYPLFGLFLSYVIVATYNFVRMAVEKQDLFSISITDGLTGLCNIRYFKMLLETEIKMSRSGMSSGFVIVLTDIDHFKKFNDTYGHQVGDYILREVSNTLKMSVRATDIVARYGGEEMVLLLKNISFAYGMEVTEKMRTNIEENNFFDGKQNYSVTLTFGVASYMPDDTVDSIIKRADEGLYKGKESGRNRVATVQ